MPNRFSLLLLTLVLLLSAACKTSERTIQTTMQTEEVAPVDLAAYEAKYDGEDGVYLDVDYSFEHVTVSSAYLTEWEFYRTVQRRYLVLNPDAEDLTTFNEAVQESDKLKEVSLRVVAPDGSMQTFALSDLTSEKDSDGTTTYKMAYPGIQKGSIIEEVFVVHRLFAMQNPPMRADVPLQYTIPCEALNFRYAYPDWWKVDVKDVGPDRTIDYTVETNEDTSKRILRYTRTNIPGIDDEPYAPFFKEVADYMQLEITELELGSEKYKGPEDWESVAARFKRLTIDTSPPRNVRRATESTTEGLTTTREKIDAIIDFVDENIEVRATDGNSIKDVMRDKAGNPYFVTSLVQAMLAHAGVPSRYMLAHSAQDGYFDPDFISNSQFYLPGLIVWVDQEEVFLFPYYKHLPKGHIPEIFQDQKALTITETGFSGLTTIPRRTSSEGVIDENYALTIDEDGMIEVTEEKVFRGTLAYLTRRSLESLEADELEDELRDMLTYTDGDVEWAEHEIIDQDAYEKPLTIRLRYTINNLVTVTPEEVIFQTDGLFSPLSGKKYKVDTDARQNPIRIYTTHRQNKNITITYPEAWTLTTALDDVEYENKFGRVEGTYATEGRTLRAEQSLRLERAFEPASEAPALLSLIGTNSNLHIPTLIFSASDDRATPDVGE